MDYWLPSEKSFPEYICKWKYKEMHIFYALVDVSSCLNDCRRSEQADVMRWALVKPKEKL